ncbi:hypothetical protein [Rugamonas rubra]|uniref:Uncharacterized protein n=1 Tax=Rugamonas rubra TaxID=758825 RepID=A0A1I4MHU2_9BURK|nr:hypothetical protein [Rugamonas rubra]SFM02646.1 hypothetical protein SAMN02982985_02398 [Rugamonas rubra]
MPTFCISVNDKAVATVNTDGYQILSIGVGASLDREELATLDVSGGSFPADGASTYLTWVPELPLLAGQRVVVEMREHGASSHAGKTAAELFPDEPPCSITDFTLTDSMFEELARLPLFRDKLAFECLSVDGDTRTGRTVADERNVRFNVLWNWLEPECARVAVRSYSLADLRARHLGTCHMEEQLRCGGAVSMVFLPE